MKYLGKNISEAIYTNSEGNPFLEAMPELLSNKEFFELIKSEVVFPKDYDGWSRQQRRNLLIELETWFYPMDYMYRLYDVLYRAMISTYQTKTILESVKNINRIHTDFRTGMQSTGQYSTQAYCGSFLGTPGIGKTSTLKRCLDLMPQVLIHKQYNGTVFYTKQINYLIVECPFDCSVKTLTFNILAAIDKAIGSNYFNQTANIKSISASALTTKLKIICLNHYIGLIVIDEIQNAIQTAMKNRQTRPLIKFLLELTNETSTGICFCGTLDAEEIFSSQEYLKRRTRGFRLLPLKYDITYRKFIMELWENQVVLKRNKPTERMMKQIYDLSGGIPAYIVKLFEEAQVQAIQSGKEEISYDVIKEVVSFLNIDVPKVYSKEGTSISDFSIQDMVEENKNTYEAIHLKENHYNLEQKGKMDEGSRINMMKSQAEQSDGLSRRFYATQRGRKPSKRESTDLLFLWKKNKDIEHLVAILDTFQMIER